MDVIPNLSDTVTIEPGQRVSKHVLTSDSAKVVVFAFDTDAELAQHSAPGPIIVQGLEGHVQFTAEGETVDLRPGGIVHLAARIPHSVRALEPSKMSLTLLRAQPSAG